MNKLHCDTCDSTEGTERREFVTGMRNPDADKRKTVGRRLKWRIAHIVTQK